MMKFKPNPLKDIVNNFREYGVLANYEEIQMALREVGVQSLSVEQLQLNLLETAKADNTHAYHLMAKENY